jgi:AraC-like DNA-binding protein/mannose-6-phosphate isomerase-like protein (cupin superfamily)
MASFRARSSSILSRWEDPGFLCAIRSFHYSTPMTPLLRFSGLPPSGGYHVALVRGTGRHWQFAAHSHDFVEVFCVIAGAGIHQMQDEVEKALTPGVITTVLPGQAHSLRDNSDNAPFTFINVAIRQAAWGRFFSMIERNPRAEGSPTAIMLYPESAARIQSNRALFEDILSSAPSEQSLPKLLRFLINLVDRYDLAEPSSGSSKWLDHILDALKDDEVLRGGLPCLLGRLNISYSHLARLCRRQAGLSPTEVINRARIDRAKHLLATSPIPVTAIGQRCGFNTMSHFYKVFRREAGTSPGAFRADLVEALSPPSPALGGGRIFKPT